MGGLAWSARYLCCPFDAWDARRAARGHAPDAGCLGHPHPNATLFAVLLCLPTAPGLPLQGNGDFGTSAFFWAALGQAGACSYPSTWGAGRKAQWLVEN
jgi:hypothetical protein